MDVATLQNTLDEIAAEYVRRLNLRIESIDEEAVTLSLPVAAGAGSRRRCALRAGDHVGGGYRDAGGDDRAAWASSSR